jgi:hypothetical protein
MKLLTSIRILLRKKHEEIKYKVKRKEIGPKNEVCCLTTLSVASVYIVSTVDELNTSMKG